MKRWYAGIVIAATLLLAVGTAYGADDEQSSKLIKEAIEGNLAEIKLAELAHANSKSTDIHSFASTLKTDHSDSLEAAKQAAKTLNVTPPTEPSAKQKETYQKLSKLSGEKFDLEFTKTMVEDHKTDIALHEKLSKYSNAGGAYAQMVLPKLRMHLEMAERLAERYK